VTTIAASGLAAPAEIRIDRWGIPHISAESLADLFFTQGFNAARDRLWQIDLWRKRGLGLLAADFGPGYLMQDRASRLFLYRGDMDAEWRSYGDDAEVICTAFAAGINAYVRLIEAGTMPLPKEFSVLGTRPGRWQPADVVRIRTHCLSRNAASEVFRANVLALADPETDLLRAKLSPPVPAEEWATTERLPPFRRNGSPRRWTRRHSGAGSRRARRWCAPMRRKARTIGRSPAAAREAAGRSLPAIRTGRMRPPRCAISST
jgi:penicillin amidase